MRPLLRGCTGLKPSCHDSTDRGRATRLRLTCSSLLTAGATLLLQIHLAPPPRRAASCLASPHPPTMAPWQKFPAPLLTTAKLMFHRGLLGYGQDGTLRGAARRKTATWQGSRRMPTK